MNMRFRKARGTATQQRRKAETEETMKNGSAEEQVCGLYVHASVGGSAFQTEAFDSLTLASEFAAEYVLCAVRDIFRCSDLHDGLKRAAQGSDTFTRAMLRYALRDANAQLTDTYGVPTCADDVSVDELHGVVAGTLASRLAIASAGGLVRVSVGDYVVEVQHA